MYSTCIFCNANLGRNEMVEAFPVGRRLAFDAKRGRLWVVCRSCERWNLSPLEERWEAIEACEALYRDARRRVSTDQVGMARLKDGLDLVRIGEPQRPEFAAWRYGDQFGRRRNRQLLISGAAVAGIGGLIAGGAAAGIGVGSFGFMIYRAFQRAIRGSPSTVVARIPGDAGTLLEVQRRHARNSALIRVAKGDPLQLRLEHAKGTKIVTGSEALRVAGQLLPAVNRFGGSRKQVVSAVEAIESAGDTEAFTTRLWSTSGWTTGQRTRDLRKWRESDYEKPLPGSLQALDPTTRLALEMALHEEEERRAMEGELAVLEEAWRQAEEIAHISDNLFLPSSVTDRLEALKSRGPEPPRDVSED